MSGFLGRVTSVVANPDGSSTLQTEPALLDDAFSLIDVKFKGALNQLVGYDAMTKQPIYVPPSAAGPQLSAQGVIADGGISAS